MLWEWAKVVAGEQKRTRERSWEMGSGVRQNR